MGTPKPLRLDYYFRALEYFAPGTTAQPQQLLHSKNVPDAVEYTKGDRDYDEVILIYKDATSQQPVCLYMENSGVITFKDTFCSQTVWKQKLDGLESFVKTLPSMKFYPSCTMYGKTIPCGLPLPIKNADTSQILGARALYNCYMQKKGDDDCLNDPLVVSTQQKIKQDDLEAARKETGRLWDFARYDLESVEERSGLFNSIKPEQIRKIIEQYSDNPYVGLTSEETIYGRLAKAKEMTQRIRATDSYKEMRRAVEKEAKRKAEREARARELAEYCRNKYPSPRECSPFSEPSYIHPSR